MLINTFGTNAAVKAELSLHWDEEVVFATKIKTGCI